MRALYRGLLETRVLSEYASKPRGAIGGCPLNFEACWAATAIDLKPGDLTSMPRAGWLVDYVRRVGARKTAGASTAPDVRRTLKILAAEKSRAAGPETLDRLLCAVGMAQALKAAGAQGVAMAYAAADDLTTAEWKRLLTVAMQGELPLVIVATPGPRDVSDIVQRMGATASVPVIPVDAGDAVAIYRVTQETLVRARADGGVAVIECVDCGVDPVALMGSQLVKKKICTEKWVAGVELGFRKKLASQ
jgi:hypothetical protein